MNPLMMSINEARRVSSSQKPSRRWQPMQLTREPGPRSPETGAYASVWQNHLYAANAWRRPDSAVIGIMCLDGEARHDWRDFQRIKNDIVGPEWEAVELYPAESRLIDTSNYFYLFCRPTWNIGRRIGRQIIHASHALAPQRPWHPGDAPPEVLA